MLAKVVVWGRDRAQATQRMEAALRNTWVVGPPTNIPLLKDIYATSRWKRGDLETGFLGLENLPQPAPLNLERGASRNLLGGFNAHMPWSREIPAGWRGRTVVAIRYVASFGEEASVR